MYQKRDHEIVDYQAFRLPGVGLLRGPRPAALDPGAYFTCVGAAQTFGCFCERPYPAILAERLALPALNFGFAGAGPRLFVRDDARARNRLEHVNRGRFAVVQVMSGRSEDNSRFGSSGLEQLVRRSDGERLGAGPAYAQLLEREPAGTVAEIVAETRANWVESFISMLESIAVPTILFWFSTRVPDYEEDYSGVEALFGGFPQLVNRAMVESVRRFSDDYVECVTSRGSPQRLFSRFTGEPAGFVDSRGEWQEYNTYYPSPEMHADAAGALTETCRKYA
jgi:hypothetical protein